MRSAPLAGLLLGMVLSVEGAYRLEEVPLPAEVSPEISAVAFSPGGKLVVANRPGDIWIADREKKEWRRFAYGLHEPLGLFVAAENEMFVSHRPEVTRLRDFDGDGFADHYETLNDEWGITDNWHEHSFGLPRDADGNLWMALGLPDPAGPLWDHYPRGPLDLRKVLNESKLSAGPYQGWLLKVTPEGERVPWASGFRQPCGVALSPEGEIFITDQQGDYIASSALLHVRRGHFYGHPAGLKWHREFQDKAVTLEMLAAHRTPEAVILPHGSMGGSPGEPVWDTTGGGFGPFAGQVFIGDFTKLISRVFLEKVAGEYQGACFPFLQDATGLEAILAYSGRDNVTIPAGSDGRRYFRDAPPLPGTRLRQGNMRMAFAPDGSLYIGQTTRGWAYGDGLQRLVWTGRTPVEIHELRLTERGFRLTFTQPMDAAPLAEPAHYEVHRFRYLYHERSGSPRVDQAAIPVVAAEAAPDGKSVELVLPELLPGFIYEIEAFALASRSGEPVANPIAYYTLNRLLSGERFTGPLSQPLFEPVAAGPSTGSGPDLREGRRIYGLYCVACHQADGRGVPGAAANFRGEPSPLEKSDSDLLGFIAEGREGTAMPPFGSILSEEQLRDVLGYVREAFAIEDAD